MVNVSKHSNSVYYVAKAIETISVNVAKEHHVRRPGARTHGGGVISAVST